MCAAILKGKVPQGTECIYRESELEADARAESHWDHRAVQSLAIYTHTSANEAWDEVQWLMGNVASSPSLIIQDSIVNNNQIFDLMTCYIVRTRLICVSFFYSNCCNSVYKFYSQVCGFGVRPAVRYTDTLFSLIRIELLTGFSPVLCIQIVI